jgi:hypothetical protein
MPQVFGPRANTLAHASILGVALLVVVGSVAAYAYVRSPWVTGVGAAPPQPIQFSHKHHVTDDGIDCRYCHTSVETSSFAGMPDTKTCMNCHSQIYAESPALAPVRESFESGNPIAWTRVNALPDYVYFDHSIHVQKGVGCSSCHGDVDNMPATAKAESLQMQFCINCHTAPQNQLRPRSEIFNNEWQPPPDQATLGRELMQMYGVDVKISCSTCHR